MHYQMIQKAITTLATVTVLAGSMIGVVAGSAHASARHPAADQATKATATLPPAPDASRFHRVRSAQNQDGRQEMFGLLYEYGDNTYASTVWRAWQITPGGKWRGWVRFYSYADRLVRLEVGSNSDGRLEIFGIASNETVWHTWQTTPGGGWLGQWISMYSPADRLNYRNPLQATRSPDGRLELFGIASDGTGWLTWQTTPAGDWLGGWVGA